MAITQYDEGTMFVPIRSGDVCPICGQKDGRCSEFYLNHELLFIACKHETSMDPMPNLPGWYKHYINGRGGSYYNYNNRQSKSIKNIKTRKITKEIINLRHKVYKDFRSLIRDHIDGGLYEEDKADLIRRGLSDKEIWNMGFFSVPKSSHRVFSDDGNYKMQLSTYISKKLYKKYGDELLRVAGFIKINGNEKFDDYITFKTKMRNPKTKKLEDIRGYFIPYNNIQNQLVGMQYRLSIPLKDDKGKLIRYFWFSSYNASSGSPIDYIEPTKIRRSDILLVGEGALKMKIACERMNFRGMAEAGVTNYRNLVKNIEILEKRENKKFNIILALDMDKYENVNIISGKEFYPILDAEEKTVDLLKKTGHKIAIAEWNFNKGKGIDDALLNGARINYRLV